MLGNNLFAYCGNNPINRIDSSGMFWDGAAALFASAENQIWAKVEKLLEALVSSFQIEVGIGYGLGASGQIFTAEASASAYYDPITLGLKNGETYTAIKGSAGLKAEPVDNHAFGLSTEYEHRFETGSEKFRDGHTTLSMPWEVYNCPHTTKNPLQFSVPIIDPIEGDLSDGFFVGISKESHMIIGYHYAIGWDVCEFWRILTE